MSEIVAFDIDGTLIPYNGLTWLKYLMDRYYLKKGSQEDLFDALESKSLPYNLTELFIIPKHETGFEYWENLNYKDFEPDLIGNIVLNKLNKLGYEILIVSKIVGNHAKSKMEWCNKHFPYAKVIFTEHKQFVKCDYLVDDSPYVLNKIEEGTIPIKYRNDYSFKEKLNSGIVVVNNFYDVLNIIRGNNDTSRT